MPLDHALAVMGESRLHLVGAARGHQRLHLVEGHVEIAQKPYEDPDVQLLEGVHAVASEGVGESRRQQARLVVAAQGVGRDAGEPGEPADGDVMDPVRVAVHPAPEPST